MKRKKIINRLIHKAIPLWIVLWLVFNSTMVVAIAEYYIMKKNFNEYVVKLSKTTQSPEELVQILKQAVLPQSGYTLTVTWGDVGQQLLQSGVIDQGKYKELFSGDTVSLNHMRYLENKSSDQMVINEENSRFMVNTLWALGLVNKSKILDEGSMQIYGKGDVMNFASTGGWNLGTKATNQVYSSTKIIELTPEQEIQVQKIARNVYRPCCGNHSEFPDCNHGMAALGYIQLAVKQGVTEDRIYKDILALNSFWFPQNYIELAAYFNKEGKEWKDIDAKLALSADYSSAQGAQKIKQSIQNIPGLNNSGGSCGT